MNVTELAREFLELWVRKRRHVLTPVERARLQELESLLGDQLPRDLLQSLAQQPGHPQDGKD